MPEHVEGTELLTPEHHQRLHGRCADLVDRISSLLTERENDRAAMQQAREKLAGIERQLVAMQDEAQALLTEREELRRELETSGQLAEAVALLTLVDKLGLANKLRLGTAIAEFLPRSVLSSRETTTRASVETTDSPTCPTCGSAMLRTDTLNDGFPCADPFHSTDNGKD